MLTAKETALLNAAAELIKENGMIALNMSDVHKRAGYSRAAQYQSFSDKNSLLAALSMRELVLNTYALEEQRYSDLSGDFSVVLRPVVYRYLKLSDRLMIDSAFNNMLKEVRKLPDEEQFIFWKRGFEFLNSEREQDK
ncbi:TetR/AcrR family transcriptional regulator [Shewanella sp. Choline-02u-19]|jgi:AcrR family transcriptional regulator|uniref:helix-turn-helix domain-containing protein n=1 Tax=unclassified Shewanella TaxID=196818 RepID=UPI000C345518|nr:MULTISPECIES: TetR/AcrR family transcriptional regulator [unclassified Shewanella]PKG56966.1 TetR/AcrR family transcriptional regulator [Shewanella sp. GutDb-MelDb]PKG72615.1 TetR/AcrR family transcriptional regulator [Shewanella sp. GutCb]PKH57006.1 TetR/AcrR family transcriptional regulator [Shewanella sp. Bg11-22]PKI27803.1 TetR/AcrR family transcriptional regulator [Shewanella sp. Choline-02u-19]